MINSYNAADSCVFANRGADYGMSGEWDKALAEVNEALRIEPGNVAALMSRGNIYSHKRQWEKAIADYSELLRITPCDAEALYNRAMAYKKAGRLGEAAVDFAKAERSGYGGLYVL